MKIHTNGEFEQKLSKGYFNLGCIYRTVDEKSKGKEFLIKSLIINEKILEKEQTVSTKSFIATLYGNIGDISLEEGMVEEAETYYINSLEISLQLLNDDSTLWNKYKLSTCYEGLGYVYERKHEQWMKTERK